MTFRATRGLRWGYNAPLPKAYPLVLYLFHSVLQAGHGLLKALRLCDSIVDLTQLQEIRVRQSLLDKVDVLVPCKRLPSQSL